MKNEQKNNTRIKYIRGLKSKQPHFTPQELRKRTTEAVERKQQRSE